MRPEKIQYESVDSIAPEILKVLQQSGFFTQLDELLCPQDSNKPAVRCAHHTFLHSIAILRSLGMADLEIKDMISVLRTRGASCDCEVLYNVVEESRLKAKYWKGKPQSKAE